MFEMHKIYPCYSITTLRLYSVSLSDIEAAKESGGVYELWELDMSGQPDRRSIAEYTVLYETIKSAHLGPAIYYPY